MRREEVKARRLSARRQFRFGDDLGWSGAVQSPTFSSLSGLPIFLRSEERRVGDLVTGVQTCALPISRPTQVVPKAELIPFFAISIAVTLVTIYAQGRGEGQTLVGTEAIPLWGRLGLVGRCAVSYVFQFVWPSHLSEIGRASCRGSGDWSSDVCSSDLPTNPSRPQSGIDSVLCDQHRGHTCDNLCAGKR